MNAQRDTIVAPATANGGSLAVIRLSGENAVTVVDAVFRGKRLSGLDGYTAAFGKITDEKEEPIDDVVALVFRAPHSYTGEDSVEISCHGSVVAVEAIISRLLSAGARMAEPGEFTRRAFLNGKMDLIQAESVADVVGAVSEMTYRNASLQLHGVLSRKIESLVDALKKIAGHLELELDFTEEDISFVKRDEIIADISGAEKLLNSLRRSFKYARILKEGVRLAIIGKPNVGKSSLLNALLKRERAIISHLPGTTRDTIEETIHFGRVLVRIVDTAGLREGGDAIERVGQERTLAAIREADFVLPVFDLSAPLDKEDEEIITGFRKEKPGTPHILVGNKADLADSVETEERIKSFGGDFFRISAKTGEGVTEIAFHVEQYFLKEMKAAAEDVAVTNLRHQEAVRSALTHLKAAKEALSGGLGNELVADDIRHAFTALEMILGRVSSEDILNTVFSSFCIGK